MSKILIQANAAGGGTVTVQSPASTADRTLTLPDGTGILGMRGSMVRVQGANGYGSTNGVIRRFSSLLTNIGVDITYADSATLGASFTVNSDGAYVISYTDSFSSAGEVGISRNSTQLGTSIGTLTNAAERLAESNTSAANVRQTVTVPVVLSAGDVIRAHTNGVSNSAAPANSQFTIVRVA